MGGTAKPRRVPEEELRLIVRSLPNFGVFLLDPEGRVASWNPGAARLLGYEEEEILGQHFSIFCPREDVDAGKPEQFLRLAREEGRLEDEAWRVRKNGSRFWANLVILPIVDSNRVLTGYATATRDLTGRQRAEEDRVRLARAEEALRLRDEFISIASHELRTPLNSLRLYQVAAELSPDAAAMKANLAKASKQAEKLTHLVERLLDATRLVAGRLPLVVQESVDLSTLVAEVIEGLRSEASRAGSEIRAKLPGDIVGRFDPLRLEQLFRNLVDNAIKYGRGGVIDIQLRRVGDTIVGTVADHGRGIGEEDMRKLFDRFQRGSHAEGAGLGLGLYISRKIAEEHGGTLTVESKPEVGSTFTVVLPLRGSDLPVEEPGAGAA